MRASEGGGLRRGCGVGWVLASLVAQAGVAAAQQPVPLRGRIEPYLGSLSRDYPVVGLGYRVRRATDSTARQPFAREFYLAAGVTWKGGFRSQADFRAPALAPGYRLAVSAAATRKARFFFPGLGNDTEFDRAFESEVRPDYYSVWRDRSVIRVDGTRWLSSRLGASLNAGAEQVSFVAIEGQSVFMNQFGSRLRETDLTVGAAVVYDSRDREAIPTRGALLQAGLQLGTGAGNYHRWFGLALGYLPVARGTVVALRAVASDLGGAAPLSARFEVPTWERRLSVFGGDDSHRGLPGGRLIGAGAILANAEVRQDLGVVKGQTISVVGFFDGGRVFEGQAIRLTADEVHLSAGMALGLRGRRERLGAVLAAVGSDGLRVSLVSGWPF